MHVTHQNFTYNFFAAALEKSMAIQNPFIFLTSYDCVSLLLAHLHYYANVFGERHRSMVENTCFESRRI